MVVKKTFPCFIFETLPPPPPKKSFMIDICTKTSFIILIEYIYLFRHALCLALSPNNLEIVPSHLETEFEANIYEYGHLVCS